MNEPFGKPWKGLLASFIFPGAGPFFAGARQRGLIWFAIFLLGPFGLLIFYSLSFVPGKTGVFLLGVGFAVWIFMLYDSYRPIRPLRWWGWILLIVVSLAISIFSSLGKYALFHVYKIPTASMKPTLSPGDQILVDRAAYWFRQPRRGDIIAFDATNIVGVREEENPKEKVIFDKRIIGLPGDTVEILDPEIQVNGVKMKFGDPNHSIEYHRRHGIGADDRSVYIVPKDKYFVLGDNSYNAYDSRYWGYLSREAICGKITKIYWPWSRTATVR